MTTSNPFGLAGSGLGLRRALLPALQTGVPDSIDFFEVSPENWVGVGGQLGQAVSPPDRAPPFRGARFGAVAGRPGAARYRVFRRAETISRSSRFCPVHRALEFLQRRGPFVRLIPDTVYRTGGQACRRPYSPDSGYSRTPHRAGKCLLLCPAATGGDGRTELHQCGIGRGRLSSASGCQQHLCQQRQSRLRPGGVFTRLARRAHRLRPCCRSRPGAFRA